MVVENALKNHFDDEIEKLLESVAEDEGLIDYKVQKAGSSMKGDGYLGVITAIDVTGKNKLGEKKTLELVVKTASKSDALRGEAPIASVFEREIYMYNTVLPSFKKFQSEISLKPFSSNAKCYKACIIDKSEALIMENLRSSGFQLWERRIPMNEDHVSFVMAEYGRFHAISFAMKDQNPEEFNKLTAKMDDIFTKFMEKGDFGKMFTGQCLKALEGLNSNTDSEAIKVFKPFIDTVSPYFKQLPQLVDKYSAILHGDCWTNNMMFKYGDSKNAKKPTEMCFIDLQIARLGPPVLDLSYYFYGCSSEEIIDNFEHYLNIYHRSLSSYLKEHGSDPEKLYPYSVFRQQWKESSKFGIICAMLLIHIMLSEQEEVADLADCADSGKGVTNAFDYNIGKVDVYNDRVRHIILHAVKNKFI